MVCHIDEVTAKNANAPALTVCPPVHATYAGTKKANPEATNSGSFIILDREILQVRRGIRNLFIREGCGLILA